MQIVVNDTAREVAVETSLADLLASLGLNAKTVAAQRNGEIVPRDAYAATLLAEGDVIELIRLVGGG